MAVPSSRYVPRCPAAGPLHRIAREHSETFRVQAAHLREGEGPAETPDAEGRRARGQLWAALMQRTFGLDVLACGRCGGRLRLIALIEQATVIERILRHLGLPDTVPAPSPARAPPAPPSWTGRLSAAEIAAVASYVRGLYEPDVPADGGVR